MRPKTGLPLQPSKQPSKCLHTGPEPKINPKLSLSLSLSRTRFRVSILNSKPRNKVEIAPGSLDLGSEVMPRVWTRCYKALKALYEILSAFFSLPRQARKTNDHDTSAEALQIQPAQLLNYTAPKNLRSVASFSSCLRSILSAAPGKRRHHGHAVLVTSD